MNSLFRISVFVSFTFVFALLHGGSARGQVGVALSGFEGSNGETIEVAVALTNVEASTGFSSFSFTILLDPGVVYLGHDKTGTLSAASGWSVNSSTTTNRVGGFSSSTNAITSSGTLIILRFRLDSVNDGVAVLLDKLTLSLSGVAVIHSPDQPGASIAAQNGRPSATAASVETDEGDPVVIPLEGSDPENDPMTFSIFRDPDNGIVNLAGSSATYTPTGNYFGTDTFEFVTNDGFSDSLPATITVTVRPVNEAPGTSDMTAPAAGASIPVSGDPARLILFSWEASIDPDGDPLAYEWQLSETDTFTNLLHTVDAAAATEINLSISDLAGILSSLGITVGQALNAHHRVVVNDGLESVAGASRAITFERGLITGTEESGTVPLSLQIDSIFPNPATSYVTVRYGSPIAEPGVFNVFDMLGRRVLRGATISAQSGFFTVSLDIESLPTGIYQVILEQAGKSHTKSLIVRR